MPVQGVCRLCVTTGELQESHLIPAFVSRWQKETSSTGFLRFGRQINRRVQDGLKPHFLCSQCEGRFNRWETPTESVVFTPYHREGRTILRYGDWFLRFCVSVSWRILKFLREEGSLTELDALFQADVDAALATWADYLLDRRPDIGPFEQHLIPLDAIAEADVDLPHNIQRYLMRAVQMDRIWTQQSAFSFAKIGRLLLIGFVREPEANAWEGTMVIPDSGWIAPRKLCVPGWLLGEVTRRADRIAELQSQTTSRQRDRIEQAQQANPKRVMESETLTALLEDFRLRWNARGSENGDG